MDSFPHWFEDDPARLAEEQYAYERRGLQFVLNEDLLKARVVVFEGSILVGGREMPLNVVYPPGFPFVRPEVISPTTSLSRHQNPISKHLCLLPNEDDAWDFDMTGADMVEQTILLMQDSAEGPEAVAENEVSAPEPQVTYLAELFRGALIISEDFQAISTGAKGDFSILVASWEPTRALLARATVYEGSKTINHVAPEALTSFYQPGVRLDGVWAKAVGFPPPGASSSFSALRRWALQSCPDLKRVRGVRNKHQKAVSDVELLAVVFTDEGPSRGQTHETWIVLASWRDEKGVRYEQVIRPALLTEQDRFSRAPELAPLARKRVVIMGLGAVGSTIAVQLGRAGIGLLSLFDYDVVEPPNLVRHEADLLDIGMSKVDVVASRVRRANPFTQVQYGSGIFGKVDLIDPRRSVDQLEVMSNIIADHDIIVMATGGGGINHLVSRIGLHADRPVVFAWVTNGAWGGRVLRMIPGQTGCYECAALSLPIMEPASDPDTPAVFARGCGYPSFTGAGFDVASISLIATRLVVQTLLRGEVNAYPDALYDHVIWQGRSSLSSDALPQIHHYKVERQERCAACGMKDS